MSLCKPAINLLASRYVWAEIKVMVRPYSIAAGCRIFNTLVISKSLDLATKCPMYNHLHSWSRPKRIRVYHCVLQLLRQCLHQYIHRSPQRLRQCLFCTAKFSSMVPLPCEVAVSAVARAIFLLQVYHGAMLLFSRSQPIYSACGALPRRLCWLSLRLHQSSLETAPTYICRPNA